MPIVGKNMLIVLPFGWVVCAYVAEEISPRHFRLSNTTVICKTGGVPWDDLARGIGRDKTSLRKWGEVYIGPEFVLSTPWEGELP